MKKFHSARKLLPRVKHEEKARRGSSRVVPASPPGPAGNRRMLEWTEVFGALDLGQSSPVPPGPGSAAGSQVHLGCPLPSQSSKPNRCQSLGKTQVGHTKRHGTLVTGDLARPEFLSALPQDKVEQGFVPRRTPRHLIVALTPAS